VLNDFIKAFHFAFFFSDPFALFAHVDFPDGFFFGFDFIFEFVDFGVEFVDKPGGLIGGIFVKFFGLFLHDGLNHGDECLS
jgi:hypothetical protein